MNAQESTCLWYLRLNGYFTIPNFIAHRRTGTVTEVDTLGVRFPHSNEVADGTQLDDDPELGIPKDRIDVVFAEAKRDRIDRLNGPWRDSSTRALHYILRRVGIAAEGELTTLADDLYQQRKASRAGYQIRIVAFANSIGNGLRKEGVTFVSWERVLRFMHRRFTENERLKAEHGAWEEFGQYLWVQLSRSVPSPDELFGRWKPGRAPG